MENINIEILKKAIQNKVIDDEDELFDVYCSEDVCDKSDICRMDDFDDNYASWTHTDVLSSIVYEFDINDSYVYENCGSLFSFNTLTDYIEEDDVTNQIIEVFEEIDYFDALPRCLWGVRDEYLEQVKALMPKHTDEEIAAKLPEVLADISTHDLVDLFNHSPAVKEDVRFVPMEQFTSVVANTDFGKTKICSLLLTSAFDFRDEFFAYKGDRDGAFESISRTDVVAFLSNLNILRSIPEEELALFCKLASVLKGEWEDDNQ